MVGEDAGDKFGPFELEELFGRGESGAVYRASDRAEGGVVVVKIHPAEILERPDFLARFKWETHLIKKLSRPAILPLLDCGKLEGRP